MNPTDDWLLERLPSSVPELTIEWMTEQKINYSDYRYQLYRTRINRRMKSLEKYGMAEWNGGITPQDRAKIWVRIEQKEVAAVVPVKEVWRE